MSSRRSGPAVVKKEETKSSSSASTVRRNSFAGLDKPAKLAADDTTTKPAPKSISGGIDSLIASVAKIAISKEDDRTIDAAAPRIIATPKPEAVKPTKKDVSPPKPLDDDEDELSAKSPIVEDVTASYVSSMKEILSSFDRTLQLSDSTTEKKVILTRSQPTAVKKEKDTALPLPRFLITGAANDDGIRVPIKRRTMPATRRETSDSVKSPSSVTAAVDEKETKEDVKDVKSPKTEKKAIKQEPEAEKDAARPRRARSRTNPFEEGDIVRSSRAPLPRRRFVPQGTAPYNCAPGIPMTNNHFGDIDVFLAGAGNRNSMSHLELYGLQDLSPANLNLGLDTSLAVEGDIYNSFSASPTPELVDSTDVDAGLGVYSSPVQPLTPPSTTNIDFVANGLPSPYGSPQTAGVYYASNSLPVSQSWSTPAPTIGSPSGSVLSIHSATPTGLTADAVMEMKRLILLPLSQDHTVLQFTPLIAAASMRLDEGRIMCLRDLEKYLLYKSQEMSPSPQTLLMFCEKFLFRCQAAMPSIEAVGGDLTRPNDTPYYEGYFMDVLAHQKEALLSQMVSASTAAAPAPAITILQRPVSLQGPPAPRVMAPPAGIHKMKPMHRPHSSINEKIQDQLLLALEQRASMGELSTLGSFFDLPISPVSQPQELGGSDNDSDDNQARASLLMGGGKRKKSIQKPQGGHVCLHRDDETGAICGKKYNRPCDLKKHGKTHSRPHKCSEPSCLYHDKGFPTEKERDRHETDRHSESPQMWYCEFPPCPYKSKRESNCKQHMEKQHDYHYERSKHNPRNPNGNAVKLANGQPQQPGARKNSDAKPINVGKPMALFEHGISTPPQDMNAYLPTLDETSEMAKIQQMYLLTPSPDTPQTFRSGSFNTWQQIPTTGAGWMSNPGLIVE
ncbi:hypothetical protein ABW21_db0202808 [Orbilia brochopaga]|nr:hypothetical protein ABW21_db0202808 [Drechslerella brochopaga]